MLCLRHCSLLGCFRAPWELRLVKELIKKNKGATDQEYFGGLLVKPFSFSIGPDLGFNGALSQPCEARN